MRSLFRKAVVEPKDIAGAAEAAASDALNGRKLQAVVEPFARHAATIGREAAEVRGQIDDARALSKRQGEAVAALAAQLGGINEAQDAIHKVARDSQKAVEQARQAVGAVGTEVGGIVDTLRQVADAAGSITRIALQTRLVAFNASVEAKRAGEAGRGFGVVADAVKALAGQVETSSKEIMSTVTLLDSRIEALAREVQPSSDASRQGAVHRALQEVESGVASVTSAAHQSRGVSDGLSEQMSRIEAEMHRVAEALDGAMTRSDGFLSASEQMIESVADCGVETPDTPFIRAAQQAAGQISRLLEDAVRTGTIDLAGVFDDRYQPIARTQPQQHTTRFNEIADRLFPQVQERVLTMSDRVVFCIAADRNGYISTHNSQYNHPQRGDVTWDTANSRWRRIFNDRTGLASARNQRPFLLQTYRRDMGGGRFVVMKECAAPITVNGRHWGGLRLAFHFER